MRCLLFKIWHHHFALEGFALILEGLEFSNTYVLNTINTFFGKISNKEFA